MAPTPHDPPQEALHQEIRRRGQGPSGGSRRPSDKHRSRTHAPESPRRGFAAPPAVEPLRRRLNCMPTSAQRSKAPPHWSTWRQTGRNHAIFRNAQILSKDVPNLVKHSLCGRTVKNWATPPLTLVDGSQTLVDLAVDVTENCPMFAESMFSCGRIPTRFGRSYPEHGQHYSKSGTRQPAYGRPVPQNKLGRAGSERWRTWTAHKVLGNVEVYA